PVGSPRCRRPVPAGQARNIGLFRHNGFRPWRSPVGSAHLTGTAPCMGELVIQQQPDNTGPQQPSQTNSFTLTLADSLVAAFLDQRGDAVDGVAQLRTGMARCRRQITVLLGKYQALGLRHRSGGATPRAVASVG